MAYRAGERAVLLAIRKPLIMMAALTGPGIGITGVSLRRGESVVFGDLTLSLNERCIGLLGDNGAGKSSLSG